MCSSESGQPAPFIPGYSLLYSTVYSTVYSTLYTVVFGKISVCGVFSHSMGCD